MRNLPFGSVPCGLSISALPVKTGEFFCTLPQGTVEKGSKRMIKPRAEARDFSTSFSVCMENFTPASDPFSG